jgi:ribulose-5-phosphate 4-epimerase/fuculose-1-phosphate aldolase
MAESDLRDALVERGRSLYDRGYAHGSSGNLSARLDEGILITPTGSSLGRLDPKRISRVDAQGKHLDGDPPSKEAFLHLAMYSERPLRPRDRAPALHLRGRRLVPGARKHPRRAAADHRLLRDARRQAAADPLLSPRRPRARGGGARGSAEHRAVLLANHGPVVSGKSLDEAVDAAEELEATAKVLLAIGDRATRPLDATQIRELEQAFPS